MSDWRESANKRRDERQSKCEIKPPSGSKKDTKKWCRGKVGVEHETRCVDYRTHKNISGLGTAFEGWKILVCSKCGKELDHWFPIRFPSMGILRRPTPAWVCE